MTVRTFKVPNLQRYRIRTSDTEYVDDTNRFLTFLQKAGPEFTVRPLAVRSSYITALEDCPRKFFFQYRCGLRRRGEFAFALEVGTIYHAMMRGLVEGKPLSGALQGASQELSAKLEEWKAMADENYDRRRVAQELVLAILKAALGVLLTAVLF